MREMKDSGVEWIGEIPVNWDLRKVKYLVKLICDKSKSNENYVGLENVESWTGNFLDSHNEAFEAEGQSISIKKGDLLFGKLRPYLAKAAIVNENGSSSTEFLVLRCEHIVNKFLWRIMLSPKFIDEVNMSTYGAKMPRASWAFIGNMYVPLPDIAEQKKIMRFLDEKCTKIDDIVKKQQVIVEKLKEYKISFVTEAVTKGLNNNVPLIDSGIAWMGNVPVGWKKYRIANLYDQTAISGREDLPILTVSINSGISDSELDEAEQERQFVRSEDRTKYKRVRPGDLVYNMMRAWQGAFGAARVDGMVSPAYVTCRPKNNVQIDSRFIEYLFRTPIAIEEMHRYSHGVADFRLRLYWNEFRNIQVCLPDINEQRIIADYIDVMMKKIEYHIRERECIVAKLKLYRSSLIYEIVTGKKAVD